MTTLKPLSQRALSSQLYDLTGDYYNSFDYLREGEKVIHIKTGKTFVFASPQMEEAYKILKAAKENFKKIKAHHKYDHHKGLIIDLNNSDRWRAGLDALKDDGSTIIEMTKDAYWHFLECVPPRRMSTKSYIGGEPYTHNSEGQAVYLCGLERDGKFYAQYGTVKQFDNNEIFLKADLAKV